MFILKTILKYIHTYIYIHMCRACVCEFKYLVYLHTFNLNVIFVDKKFDEMLVLKLDKNKRHEIVAEFSKNINKYLEALFIYPNNEDSKIV